MATSAAPEDRQTCFKHGGGQVEKQLGETPSGPKIAPQTAHDASRVSHPPHPPLLVLDCEPGQGRSLALLAGMVWRPPVVSGPLVGLLGATEEGAGPLGPSARRAPALAQKATSESASTRRGVGDAPPAPRPSPEPGGEASRVPAVPLPAVSEEAGE